MTNKILMFIFATFISTMSLAATSKPIIAEYFGIWTEHGQAWEDKFRPDAPFNQLNRLYISFGKLIKTADGHFSLDFDGDAKHAQDLIMRMKKVNPTAEIFLIAGGDGRSDSYGGAANDTKFAENVRLFLEKYGFDGFDIDWEASLNKTNLNNLVTHLYTELHPKGYQLTLDVWPFVSTAYDVNVLKNNLDQMNIMSYGANRDLGMIVNHFEKAGFPANQLIGGIETETGYYDVTDTLGANGSIAKKSAFAKEHGLAGMMGWRMDNDNAAKDRPNYPTYQGAIELWKCMSL
ncbi:MAG: glycoside hydrolase family protein [uncultured bacterium]|nr:MAG: glycoside hydrolase family protein [uncultured bacterium]